MRRRNWRLEREGVEGEIGRRVTPTLGAQKAFGPAGKEGRGKQGARTARTGANAGGNGK